MRWIAMFEDRPEAQAGWVRKQHAQDHFDYLAANSARIRVGGGLREAPEGWYCGGLWVLEAASREEAVRLCEADPYFKLGLRKGYRLYVWGKAPCFSDVVI